MKLNHKALVFAAASFCTGGMDLAHGSTQQILSKMGSGSFIADKEATTATYYSQTAEALVFRTTIGLGDTIGGRVQPFRTNLADAALGFIMKVNGNNPGIPFTAELFDADLNVCAVYTANTKSAGSTPVFVPLERISPLPANSREIAGLQFTWDGEAPLDVEVLALALMLPGEPPDPNPEPTPTQPPTAQPPAAALPPSVSITSPATTRQSAYRLQISVTDGHNPTQIQYRLRAPGSRKFGRWITVSLSDGPTSKHGAPRLILNKRGRWQVEVQVTDKDGQTAAKTFTLRRR